ncbi:MAG TPA: hypothetical protein GXX29_13660 [Firmicutes bacterium]|nr:hypothetical protein [Bacillota bacterium]
MIIWAILTYILTGSLSAPVLSLLGQSPPLVRKNYAGKLIPTSAGILLPLGILPVFLLIMMWETVSPGGSAVTPGLITAGTVVLLGYGLLGLFDDLAGDEVHRGWRAHFAALRRGQITSGGLKALWGLVIAILAALFAGGTGGEEAALSPARLWNWTWLLAAALIALGANTINLFDLRPGRALKVFFLLYFLVFLAAGHAGGPLLCVAAAALALLPADLKARAMLGDAGANPLGGIIGLYAAMNLSPVRQVAFLLAMLALNAAAERLSFSRWIDLSPSLRWLDRLGRDAD